MPGCCSPLTGAAPSEDLGMQRIRSVCLVSILSAATVFSISCAQAIKGEFAWAPVYDRDMPDFERSLNHPTSFRFGREHLYFGESDTIWWIYRIQRTGLVKGDLLAVLYSLSGSPEPVEIDLRQVKIEKSGEQKIIRQYYNPLPLGDYRLALAAKDQPFDRVEFSIVRDDEIHAPSGVMPGDTYSGEGEADIVRYSHADAKSEDAL